MTKASSSGENLRNRGTPGSSRESNMGRKSFSPYFLGSVDTSNTSALERTIAVHYS